MLLFTSDSHFGHVKMAVHRGFDDPDAMDEALIEAWNGAVTPKDVVYHLGDLSFRRPEATVAILKRLNGAIRLVPGNHDVRGNRKMLMAVVDAMLGVGHREGSEMPKFEVLERLYTLKIPGTGKGDQQLRLELCHFPLLVWDRAHYNALHLHGHSHGRCNYPDPGTTRLDVGVDSVGFAPITLDRVLEIMKERAFKAHDLHDPARVKTAVLPTI